MGLAALRTLVVDDHPLMTHILGAMLRAFGVQQLRVAAGVDEALQVLSGSPIDLLVTDLELKDGSGLDLTAFVRTSSRSPWRQMPVILVTAYSDRMRIERARDAGVTEIVTKPISAQMLMTRLINAIDRPRSFVEAPGFVGPDRRRRAGGGYSGRDRRTGRDNVNID